jgi:hypothetical protein
VHERFSEPPAVRDGQVTFTAENTFQAAIYGQLKELATMPTRHPLAVENPAFPFEIREKLVGLGCEARRQRPRSRSKSES